LKWLFQKDNSLDKSAMILGTLAKGLMTKTSNEQPKLVYKRPRLTETYPLFIHFITVTIVPDIKAS
jgi:hypothetical protein